MIPMEKKIIFENSFSGYFMKGFLPFINYILLCVLFKSLLKVNVSYKKMLMGFDFSPIHL